MAVGTKVDGIHCIIANTEVEETLMETGEKLDPLIRKYEEEIKQNLP
ncbi:hypothetical protein [Gracilibacillus caseinilyticus]